MNPGSIKIGKSNAEYSRRKIMQGRSVQERSMQKRSMRKKTILWLAVILGSALTAKSQMLHAQDAASPKSVPPAESAADARPKADQKPIEAYHLDVSINELEDGKKINTRQYAINLNTNDSNEIKIGTRVPVETKEGEFQYLDLGTSILARVEDHKGPIELTVRAEISNFALPEQAQEKHDPHPAIRQLKISGSTLLPLSKPMVIGGADDPNSKRQFQLEVTVTKLR
jgi:hypothetical protein